MKRKRRGSGESKSFRLNKQKMFPVETIGEAAAADRDIEIRALGSAAARATWRVPEETPVAFVYNRRNYAVMLATPQDLVDYAAGFSLTEGVVDRIDDVLALDVVHAELGVDLRFKIAPDCLERFDVRQRRRNLPGVAGCGVCGLENAEALFAELPKVSKKRLALKPASVLAAIHALAAHQPLNKRTRSVHGAAWVGLDGEILYLREDIGRHNAMDKLLGALAIDGAATDDGFVLMSSRCSYELVEKAARRGVKALVSISGPTGFAVKKAKEANMALYARTESGAVELLG